MKLFKILATALSVAVLCMLAAPTATADDWSRKTVVTFSGTVEVPGVGVHTLPAGIYVFKILDSQSDRHIVQIFDEHETHVLTTILAIPNYRLKSTNKTVITFRERPAGEPESLKAWFYPGRQWGEEFVYARPRALELAKEINEPVLSTPVELADDTLKTAPIEAVAPTGEPVELTQVVEPPPATTEPAPVAEPVTVAKNELPKTASSLPMIALLGFLSLAAALGLMFASKRVA